MEKGNDYIKFASRSEVQDVWNALEKYLEQNPKEENETIKQMISFLDEMDMNW